MHELSETMYRASAARNATLIESLVSLETVKAIGVENAMQRKWEHNASFLTEAGSKLKLLSSSINNGANTIQQLITVVLILLGVYLVTSAGLTPRWPDCLHHAGWACASTDCVGGGLAGAISHGCNLAHLARWHYE